jgi:hypothetical protein
MRFSALVSLLLTSLISFVESAKNTGKLVPSTLPEILKRFKARREELLQLGKDHIAERLLAKFQADDANPRELQTSTPAAAALCNVDGSLNVDDDYTQVLFDGDFETNCTCSEGTRVHIDCRHELNVFYFTNAISVVKNRK